MAGSANQRLQAGEATMVTYVGACVASNDVKAPSTQGKWQQDEEVGGV